MTTRLATTSPEGVDQTSPRDAGHTTSEHFWTKVLVILGAIISAAGIVEQVISTVGASLPGSWANIAIVIGAVVALLSKIAYEVSRTIVKLKLADADAKVEIAKLTAPTDAAATVLGEDAPQGSRS